MKNIQLKVLKKKQQKLLFDLKTQNNKKLTKYHGREKKFIYYKHNAHT